MHVHVHYATHYSSVACHSLQYRCLDDFKRQMEKMDDSKDSLTQRITAAEDKIQSLTRVSI